MWGAMIAFVPARSEQFRVEAPRDADGVSATRAEVGCDQRHPAHHRIAHGLHGTCADEGHVGERDHVALRVARGPGGTRKARAHALVGIPADCDFEAFGDKQGRERIRPRAHHRNTAWKRSFQAPRRGQRDRQSREERVEEFVGSEAGRRARREQDADRPGQDPEGVAAAGAAGATSHAEAAKRFSFAAQSTFGTP